MPKINLVSQEWCNLVFEGKNKDYGAYLIRSEAGKRNLRALLGVGITLLAALLMYIVTMTISDRLWQQDINMALEQMKLAQNYRLNDVVLHFVDLSQPKEAQQEAAPLTVPEIVEQPKPKTIAQAQPESADTVAAPPLQADTAAMVKATQEVVEEIPLPAPSPSAEALVETMPTFPGGLHELMKWLDRNIIYPPLLRDKGIEGTTYLTFMVDTAGMVQSPKIEEPLHPMISSAILKAAERMPKWEPALGSNVPPVIKITIPIAYYKR